MQTINHIKEKFMHKSFKKRIALIFFITMITNHQTTKTTTFWDTYCTKENIILSALGTTTALLVGKTAYTIYYNYLWPNKLVVAHCRQLYKTIYNIIQNNRDN